MNVPMGITRARRALLGLALAAAVAAAGAAPAGAITVTSGNGAGIAGQNVDIAINTTSTTGLAIQSLQFDLSYTASVVTAVDVLEAGDLTAGWGEATFNVTPGRISISHAGTSALSGSGALLHIRFLINPAQLSSTSTFLTLSNLVFNEGVPNDTIGGPTGALTVNATPTITVAPQSAELIRGQTLQFTLSGSVVAPVTWSTTNPTVASISSAGLLTANAPGTVRVNALDNAGHTDASDGDVVVRGMGLTAVGGSVYPNNSITALVNVTDLGGLGVRAGQVSVTYNASLVTPTGVVTTGTMLDGYGTVVFGVGPPGTCTVDFAGNSDLTGSGTLFKLTFVAGPSTGSVTLGLATGLFNETLPAKTTNGSITINTLPTLVVNPDTKTLLVGQTQQFTITGTPVPPLTWSVTDATVASIDPATGLLTAIKGGTTQVKAQDNVGASDLNTLVDVYDLQVSLDTLNVVPGGTVSMPLSSDRRVGSLNIRSVQYELSWTGAFVTNVASTGFGLIPAWSSNIVTSSPTPTSWRLVAAAAQAMANTDSVLHRIAFTVSPSASVGTNIPITFVAFLANEGAPRALRMNGLLQVRTTVDVPEAGVPERLTFAAPWPNPGSRMVFDFGVPRSGPQGARVRLEVVGVDGRRVRTLVDGTFTAGRHETAWDGADDAGRPVPAGVYFARLEGAGAAQVRKVVRLP